MVGFADIATELNICKTMAIVLPKFYKKTGISAQVSFTYDKEQNIEISLGFAPSEPSEEQYSLLMEELFKAEKLITDEHIINISKNYENLQQLVFKHKEEINRIIDEEKRND